SEEFEGREAGTPGEIKAAEYIRDQMIDAGLKPLFGDSYFQSFEFPGQWVLGSENYLEIESQVFVPNRDYYVLPNSASDSVFAPAIYVGHGVETDTYNDYSGHTEVEGKIFFIEYYSPDSLRPGNMERPHVAAMQRKVELARDKGAAAVIFVNNQLGFTEPNTSLRQNLGKHEIPVLYARSEVFEYWQQLSADTPLLLSVDLSREVFNAYNVAGYIDNNASQTVVIGGHYDHLGYGGAGSRSPGVNAIHYGADDNASGTAGVLEAARYLSKSDLKGHNYVFVGFSAEEKGLLGSRYFATSGAIDPENVNYMLNLDMIGRVEDLSFTIYGTGTSPLWDSLIDKFTPEGYTIRKSPSGMGGSDHTNFYRENIPVLFFFTGLHEDYHRPADTEDKINYDGTVQIMNMIYQLIEELDNKQPLEFTETAVARRETSRRSGPALGIMPDHAYDGTGLRVLSVSENNPAHKAGMKNGDIIVGIGDMRVSDIYTYMQAIGSVDKTKGTTVTLIRNGTQMKLEVRFE
ncbi:MAG: M20/M25/M40 family metallo-hydrolase, partial [Bacteroidota bacterium]